MIEDKVIVTLLLLAGVALMMLWPGRKFDRSQLAGTGFFPALFVWLGVPLTHPLSWVASIVAALSVPLLVYGLDGVRDAFTPQREV
jgi:hypothetical protein